jgi:hypothetical protein
MASQNKKTQIASPPLLLITDIASLLIAFILSTYLRSNVVINNQIAINLEIPLIVYFAIPAFWIFSAIFLGMYKKPSSFLIAAVNVLINGLLLFAISKAVMPSVSRLIYVFYAFLSVFILYLFRGGLKALYASGTQSRSQDIVLRVWQEIKSLDVFLYSKRGDLIIVFLLSLFWVVLNYRAGFNYSPDSVEYITMASKLRYSGQFAFLPYWPPLFPLLITLASFISPFPANAATLVVGASAIAAALAFALLVRRVFQDALLTLVTVSMLLGMGAFLKVGTTIWSEMPFLAFSLLSMVFVQRFGESFDSRSVYLALLFAGFAAITRYIGSAQLVAVTGLLVWLSYKAEKRIPIWQLLISNSFFLLVLGLFSYRNKLVFGQNWFDTWMGPRNSLLTNLPHNLPAAMSIIASDLGWPLIALLILSLVIFVYQVARKQQGSQLLFLLIVPVSYLAALLYSASIYSPVALDPRLLFPAYALLVAFAVAGGYQVLQTTRRAKNQFIRYYAPFLVVVLISLAFMDSSRGYLEYSDDVFRHRNQPTTHFHNGYDLSSTSDQLAKIFAQTLSDRDVIDIYVFVPSETYGRTFLLQENIYRDLNLSTLEYSYGEDQNYSVLLRLKTGQEKKVNYWFTAVSQDWYTPAVQDPERLVQHIENTLTQPSSAFLVVFLLNQENQAVWDSVLSSLSQHYLATPFEAEPYRAAFFSAN